MAKIIIIGSYAPSLVNFRGDLIACMIDCGNEVIACAPDASEEIVQELDGLGAEYTNIPLSRTGLNLFNDIRTFATLFILFRKVRPDVVLAYTIKPVIYGSIAAKVASIPAMYSMITGLGNIFVATGKKAKVIRFLVSILYRFSLATNRRIFFQNPDDLAEFRQRVLPGATDKGVLINGSGINTSKFRVSEFPSTMRFLLIARLLKDKGLFEYVRAASIIKNKYPGVKFDLVGPLDENPACISRAALEEWIDSGVIGYLGELDDVRIAIANASVYVLPSYREGTPRTVLEAMAMGRPIITTDAPGCRETVVDGENGFLVPTKSVDKLVGAMEKFILNPKLIASMGKRSREIAEDKYDAHKVNQVILENMGLS
ncbi:MAG: glycosyltransferase family 4 protein [Pseudomonadales bacterium]|nr:glycosyltransferase family 4 protein [Pseudomonadales bacterium]